MDVLWECCVLSVYVTAKGRSLVRRSPTECGVCVISKPQQLGGLGPTRAVVPEEKIVCIKNRNHDYCHYTFLCNPCHFLSLSPTLSSVNLLCSTLRTGMLFTRAHALPAVECVRARAMDMTALMTLRVDSFSLIQALLMPPILKFPVTWMRASETPMPFCHMLSSPELE
jgi:hypothetical protein